LPARGDRSAGSQKASLAPALRDRAQTRPFGASFETCLSQMIHAARISFWRGYRFALASEAERLLLLRCFSQLSQGSPLKVLCVRLQPLKGPSERDVLVWPSSIQLGVPIYLGASATFEERFSIFDSRRSETCLPVPLNISITVRDGEAPAAGPAAPPRSGSLRSRRKWIGDTKNANCIRCQRVVCGFVSAFGGRASGFACCGAFATGTATPLCVHDLVGRLVCQKCKKAGRGRPPSIGPQAR
jgi:hypothetical protein